MPFTGSEAALSSLIVANLSSTVSSSDPEALQNLQATADALAKAIVAWITTAGVNSIIATVGPGIPVTTAGSPSAQAGATVGPGSIITSSLV